MFLKNTYENYNSLFSLGIYVLIGEIFWDIRDISADKENNTKTIPIKVYPKNDKIEQTNKLYQTKFLFVLIPMYIPVKVILPSD